MNLRAGKVLFAAVWFVAPTILSAQDFVQDLTKLTRFTVLGKQVQIHGFASQGFALSDGNNYLTMKTSDGSFAFTDGGVNASVSITDKFRIGAQAYVSNVGQLGRGHVSFDWGFADYKFKDWFGVRGGKVKTALGLLNDTQDMEFLHTWAILPQSIYPIDLRSSVIAHTGGDVYGDVSLHKAGSVSYTAYAGIRQDDRFGGLYYGDGAAGSPVQHFAGRTTGVDVRWHTPVSGLMFGGSWADQTMTLNTLVASYGNLPLVDHSEPEHVTSVYGDYARGKWHFDGEFRRDYNYEIYTIAGATAPSDQSSKGWFLGASYRAFKRLELGTYHSRFYVDAPQTSDPASNHIFDQTVTARVDIAQWWDVKVEGHFIDGYGDTYSAHGFYSVDNPQGLKPKTKLLVLRMGFNF
jgi:hypothetical protein